MTADPPLQVCETCRKIRLATVFCFLLSTSIAGFFWAHVETATTPAIMLAAIAFSILSAMLVLAIEVIVTKTELEAKMLFLRLKSRTEEVRLLQEKINKLERSIDPLAKDDQHMRERLPNLSVHTSQRME